MRKDTKEIICVIFVVGGVILAALGRWYLGFIFLIFYLFLPKTKEEKTEKLKRKLMFHLFQKRDWQDRGKVKQQLGKELEEMERDADEIEKEL
ncbi:MAG: hypothetical protein HYT20_00405 [Candidatus Nealsonbacteria bacterium]|nr:hypothetical protein [Candidatus Nealsonbacteria bacterium]